MKLRSTCFLILLLSLVFSSCLGPDRESTLAVTTPGEVKTRPYTRWWWFASEITKNDIKHQLDWLNEKQFGGVEIAFIYPPNRDPDTDRIPWLSPEWTGLVTYAKQYCDSIGLGCDFTFGTLWPFGGTFVPDSDRTKIFGEPGFRQPLRLSWTHPDTGNVIDHMSRGAFERYAAIMGKALEPAMAGSRSALFCDSWEVETRRIWTDGFGEHFNERYGYAIEPYMDDILGPGNAAPRYDYMKLVAENVLQNFYIPFHEHCRGMNGLSRVQCAGSPTDILSAYAVVDIPETEAMLYNPSYSRIVASAAALTGKPLVSAETFTCLYGWPAAHIREERTADLKLLADALFANGTNHIIWHGTPFNPAGIDTIYFYASVHVGERGSLEGDLIRFNQYLEKVAALMRRGTAYADLAVYIPQEDAWIAGEYPPEKQLPWAWGEYEMRYVTFPGELEGYQPLWINRDFLSRSHLKGNELEVGPAHFKALYVDVDHMDMEALETIHGLALNGFPVCLKKSPLQAGMAKDQRFGDMLMEMERLSNVSADLNTLNIGPPLVDGRNLPEFWCRRTSSGLILFFAHPFAKNLEYPMVYGMAESDSTLMREVVINYEGRSLPLTLKFEPCQSLAVSIDTAYEVHFENIHFLPDERPAE